MGEVIKMRRFKFLSIIFVVSMLFISVLIVAGEQIPMFSEEKSKIDISAKINSPFNINKFGEFFQSIVNHFINILPTFIIKLIRIENNKEEVGEENNENIIDIENPDEEIIIDGQEDIKDENKKDTVENDPTEEKVNEPEEKQQERFELDFILELDEVFEYGKSIPVRAIIINKGNKHVFLCEMDVKLRTLDFEIVSPDGFIVHYIGPFEGKAKAVKLEPCQSIIIEINLTASNVTFGEVMESPYGLFKAFSFIPGTYTIKGLYNSYQALTVDTANYFEGELFSPIYKFTVKS